MKCPLRVQLHLCHGCKCSACCKNSPNSNQDGQETEDAYNMFDLMAQNTPQNVTKRKTKKSKRNPTTYREDYCRKKRIQSPAKLQVPFSSLFIPNRKMFSETTHKSEFRPYKDKETKPGEIVTHHDNLACPKSKFEGKSETKSAYDHKRVYEQHKAEEIRGKQNKENIKLSDKKMETSTTYKSTYKRPKNFKKSEMFKPNVHRESPPPFNHTTQYQWDFKKPKKVESENFKKTSVYHAPTILMENKTTYKTEFYNKFPVAKNSRRKQSDQHIKTNNENCHCRRLEITLRGCLSAKQPTRCISCQSCKGDNGAENELKLIQGKTANTTKTLDHRDDKIECGKLNFTCNDTSKMKTMEDKILIRMNKNEKALKLWNY